MTCHLFIKYVRTAIVSPGVKYVLSARKKLLSRLEKILQVQHSPITKLYLLVEIRQIFESHLRLPLYLESKNLQHNIEYHIYHLIPHHILTKFKEKGK